MNRYITILVVALISLSSCNRERGDEPQPLPPLGPTDRIEYDQTQVEISASLDQSRLHQYFDTEKNDGTLGSPFLSGRRLRVRVFIRGDGLVGNEANKDLQRKKIRVEPQIIDLTVIPKENRATYTGILRTPRDGKNMRITAFIERELPEDDTQAVRFLDYSFHDHKDPNQWVASATSIEAREMGGGQRVFFPVQYENNGKRIVKTQIPYFVQDVPFTLKTVGRAPQGEYLKRLVVDNSAQGSSSDHLIFKPSAMLLAIQIDKEPMDNPLHKSLEIDKITIISDQFSYRWNYPIYTQGDVAPPPQYSDAGAAYLSIWAANRSKG